MNSFLLAVGWWNFGGSLIMLFALNQKFGKKLFNDWTKIFKEEFTLDYWGKFWLFWAAGLNVFFGLVNVLSVKWGYEEIKYFLVYSDIFSYTVFLGLGIWGLVSGRCAGGIYSVFVIFLFWLSWACYALMNA